MIYRPTERAGRGVRRSISGEVALAVVATALLSALLLQGTCSGWEGESSRWLCVNNQRLAEVRDARATPTAASARRPGKIGDTKQVRPAVPGADLGASGTPGIDDPPETAPRMGIPTTGPMATVLMAPLQTATAMAAQRELDAAATLAAPPIVATRPAPATRTPRPTRTPRVQATASPTAPATSDDGDVTGPTGTPTAGGATATAEPTTEDGYPGPTDAAATASAVATETAQAKSQSGGYP
jgi:hypothetical protein